MPGAFEDGAQVVVSAYGHQSWNGALPVGKATIHADHEKAWADVQFLMTTQAGRDTFERFVILVSLVNDRISADSACLDPRQF